MRNHRAILIALAGGLSLAGGLVACSKSSSGHGAIAPGSTTAPTSSNVPTTPSRTVTDLRVVGAPLVAGDVPVAFRLVDPNAQPADISIGFSVDGGQSWSTATSNASRAGLQTGAALGIEHIIIWSTTADVPGFEADVRLRVEIVGGGSLESAPFAVDNQPLSSSVQLERRPWLQSLDQDSVIILWRTVGNTDSVIELGTTPALGQTFGDPQASTNDHVVHVTGLQPGTDYYYRVASSGQSVTRRLSFETAPATGELEFIVFGDSGAASPEQLALAQQMQGEAFDFVLHTGDLIYPAGGFGNTVGEYNARFFTQYNQILDEKCIYPSPGNHDSYAAFYPYLDTFMPPTNNWSGFEDLFYAFEWGDAKFIMLDSSYLFRYPIGTHSWLLNELNTNTKKWVIVFMHHPLWSAGSHGDDSELINILGPIFENNGVDLVLTGHEHNYERTKAIKQFNTSPGYNGLAYVITGGGGTTLRPITPNANTEVAASVHHYVKFRTQGDTLIGEAVSLGGQVIDSFAIFNQ